MDIRIYLEKKRLLMDGAMGTYFASRQEQGNGIPELALKQNKEEIKHIHKAYQQAGAKLLRTNTFAANQFSLGISKEEATEILKLAVQTAREAVREQEPVFLAGDIGPVPEHAKLEENEILNEYKRMCRDFLNEGIDIILFETFSRLDHIEIMTKWLREEAKNSFIMVQFLLNKSGYTMDGVSASRIIKTIAKQGYADSVGFNCGIGSGPMEMILRKLDLSPLLTGGRTKYFSAAPNAAYPQQRQNRMQFMDNVSYFAEHMAELADMGVDILGCCCGTTPGYTQEIEQKIIWECSLEERNKKKRQKNSLILKEKETPEKPAEKKKTFLEKLKEGKKVIAVELDPPYDADCSKVLSCGKKLEDCEVDLITMADSPMGRSRIDSILMSIYMAKEIGIDLMPHVCCRDKNMIAMRSGLMGAYIHGIRNILIVTGDPVPGTERNTITSVFDYNSIRLMQRVKEMNLEHFKEDPLIYGGALNYGRGNLDKIAERMEKKIEAGASYFLTQPVFSEEDMERIAWLKKRVETKILCGIMPLVSYKNAKFIQNEITGVYVPDEIVNRYHPEMSREEGERAAVSLIKDLTKEMEQVADGFYFMLPFNRVSIIEKYQKTIDR